MRKSYYWKCKQRELALGGRTLIMGVLNVTPDSFSDGGKYSDPDAAYARALALEEQGADIIDIGAESTRPDAKPIGADEELRRLVPVLKRLRDQLTIPISVDTYKSEVAERALELGVEIINDPTGLTYDPDLSSVVAKHDAGLIINHMRGRPETWAKLPPLPEVMLAVTKDLDAAVNRARRNGVDRSRMMVDPGIGFGKRKEQNLEILARLREMDVLDLPVLVGPSRKSFLAQTTEPDTRLATAAAVTAAILNGAHMVRVHDVAEMRMVAALADEILKAIRPAEPEEKPKTRTLVLKPRADSEPEVTRAKPLSPPMQKRAKPVEDMAEEAPAEEEATPERRPLRMPPAAAPERRPFAKPGSEERERPYRKPAGEGDRPYRKPAAEGESRPYQRPAAGESRPYRKPAGDGEPRPYRRTADDGGARPPYRKPAGDGERRPFQRAGARPASEGRPAFGKGRPGSEERRPPYRPAAGGAGERRPFSKGEGSGERRPPFRKAAGGEERRPPFRDRASGPGERRPAFGKGPAGGGDKRPPFRKAAPAGGEERRPYSRGEGGPPEKRPFRSSEGRPPFKKRTGPPGSGGARPPRSGKPGGRPKR